MITPSTILEILENCKSPSELPSILTTILKTASLHPFITNQFISKCAQLRHIPSAISAFNLTPNPNTFIFNALLNAFLACSLPYQTLRYYLPMRRTHVPPTAHTFSAVLAACGREGAVPFGLGVHGEVWKRGVKGDVFVGTGLVEFYGRVGRVGDAEKVFGEMGVRDEFCWTAMVGVFARVREMESAWRVFGEMPERGVAALNAMIGGCLRVGDVGKARSLFEVMPVRDKVSWTAMISGYVGNRMFREAVETFVGMRDADVVPDEVTMSAVVSACAHLGSLRFGEEIHRCVLRFGFELDVFIGSALVDMYAKCGCLEKSLTIFFKLRERNIFCWNSAIEALGVHGFGTKAIRMLHLMLSEEGIKPNGVTFISILSACTHAGLVEDGRRIFSSMVKDHGITLEIEHYGCMVDLLARAGLLEEALCIVEHMLVEPNSVIWGSMLSGCRTHKNVEIGRIAAAKLAALGTDESGYNLLSINIFVEADRWDEVVGVRAMMGKKGVQKSNPGHSWIEVDGEIHEFMACDTYHPLCDEIYLMVDELYGQVKFDNYHYNTKDYL